ncbi:hypothetical protein CDD81_4771 [Ophiocordyceps australis]|uniref:Fungal STAND N-terminal Goodbye domain-containing protein n=1 Tax=Ophiocordyceps australis TaxID=1399860 RepID=A0A2C5Y6G1_9HYPO|nr:hypothetical protein CDD81_4771 [Ophiocordyceps australis]
MAQDARTVEKQFADIVRDAAVRYKQKSGQAAALKDFLTPPMKSVDDLKVQIALQNDRFVSFRSRQKKLFDAIIVVLRPVQLVGDLVAGAASQAFAPSQTIFGAVLLLINTAQNVSSAYESLIALFDKLKEFTARLDVYLKQRISSTLHATLVSILATIFEVFILAANEIREGRVKTYLKRLIGSESAIQPALDKLNSLTQGEGLQVLAETYGSVSEISDKADQIETIVTQVQQNVQSLRLERSDPPGDSNRDRLRKILSPTPFPLDTYNSYTRGRAPGTGIWIVRDEAFLAWALGYVPFLWISGNAGTGKSYLTANLITWAIENSLHMPYYGYFFFRSNNAETRSVLQALRDAVYQLSEKDAYYCKDLMSSLRSKDDIRTIASAFRELLIPPIDKTRPARPKYIILDGIDEADEQELHELLTILSSSHHAGQAPWAPYFRFALIGRSFLSDDVVSTLDSQIPGRSLATIQITGYRNAHDVELFVYHSVRSSRLLIRTKSDFQDTVAEAIIKQSDGLFIVAKLMIEEINRKRHRSSILESLASYPKELDAILHKTVSNLCNTISSDEAKDLNEMLAWIACAEKPLTLEQLESVMMLSYGEVPLLMEESLRRQFTCFFDLEREDGLTTDDLLKDFERVRRDSAQDRSPIRRLSPRRFNIDEVESSPSGRTSSTGRSSTTSLLSSPPLSPTLQLSPPLRPLSDLEFRSNKSTTRVTFFHNSVRQFFRRCKPIMGRGPEPENALIYFNLDEARLHVLKTCLRVFIDRPWFAKVDLGPGKQAFRQYAAWYWQEHLASIDLGTVGADDKRALGQQLLKMLTDDGTIFDWSILYEMHCDGLEVLSDCNIECIQRWLGDGHVTADFDHDGRKFARKAKDKAAHVCERIGRLYSRAWLSDEFKQYVTPLFCFKIVQNVACMNAGYKWSHAKLHWSAISIQERFAKATKWADQPETAHWHTRLASAYATLKMHSEALKHYDIALEMDPGSVETCSRKASCLFQDRQDGNALSQVIECIAMEERKLQNGGLVADDLKISRLRLYKNYYLAAQCSYRVGKVDQAHVYFRSAIDSAPNAELDSSQVLEPEKGYLEVLAGENLYDRVMDLVGYMSQQCKKTIYGPNRFVDLLLDGYNSRLVMDWIPKAASTTSRTAFLVAQLCEAIDQADSMRDSLRHLYLRLALGMTHAYNRHLDTAIAIFEQISLVECRPRGTISTRQAYAASFQNLAALYREKALHLGLKHDDVIAWMRKLHKVEEKQREHGNFHMPPDMLGSDVNTAAIYLAGFYRLQNEHVVSKRLLQDVMYQSLAILSDSEPANDVFGLDNLLRIFTAAGDETNARALARSMRKTNPEASFSTPSQTPGLHVGEPKLPEIHPVYDRSCFECLRSIPANEEFGLCTWCIECYCLGCLDGVIRKPGNVTAATTTTATAKGKGKDRAKDKDKQQGRVMCKADHEWLMVRPLNRTLHTGEILLDDESIASFGGWLKNVAAEWKIELPKPSPKAPSRQSTMKTCRRRG